MPSSSTRAGASSSPTARRAGSCGSTRGTGRLRVHATGLDEPTGLAAAAGVLYVADFHAGLVRRVSETGRVTTLARLPEVTAVAATPSRVVYAVTMDGTLARISPGRSRSTRIRVAGGLDRPHGVAIDRSGRLLVAEDSRRVRRVDPATGRVALVADRVDTNRIAVGRRRHAVSRRVDAERRQPPPARPRRPAVDPARRSPRQRRRGPRQRKPRRHRRGAWRRLSRQSPAPAPRTKLTG